ncbi:MAG: hypothetical protein GY828_04055 [Candidatus Gracilibacteria bacterium]|nr:hypothetical protein [Candidatus Gracilibacteria bacterium]
MQDFLDELDLELTGKKPTDETNKDTSNVAPEVISQGIVDNALKGVQQKQDVKFERKPVQKQVQNTEEKTTKKEDVKFEKNQITQVQKKKITLSKKIQEKSHNINM